MAQRSAVKATVATAAGLAIALSVSSIRQQWDEADAAKSAGAVIQQQLEAFRKDDYRGAYRHAAPEIQDQFPVEAFRRMVREGYPQIARSREATIGTPVVRRDVVEVPVTVTGEDDVTADVLYMMRRVGGRWRVAGVMGGGPPGSGNGSPGTGPGTPPEAPTPGSPAPKEKQEPDAA